MSSAPAHYTSLKPFRDFFASGMPCLTYHKIAPRPRGVRIKGLYLNPRLFQKQMGELAKAGYTTPPYGHVPIGPNGGHTLSLSFDDGFVNAFRMALEILAQYKFRAIQFLVADRIGQFNEWEVQLGDVREPLMDTSQIREWLAAGHQIGAHTLTHPFLTRVSIREAREEIFSSKKKLEDLFGLPIRHFCYPYGDRNQAIRDMVLEAGYTTACTTDFGVNTADTHPLELRRIMARHRSISIKAIKAQLAG
ncbi:MAG TPA: polysaccharide deacetylase family protein [Verrucomicrobiae bacterium]|nr:polysaccharide deacetylase family protein [Verrucomicrobiae bacterium]